VSLKEKHINTSQPLDIFHGWAYWECIFGQQGQVWHNLRLGIFLV
jgi:hypothetical protein